MKKFFTFTLAILATMSMWAAYDVPATGSPVTLSKKVSNGMHFTTEASGLYHFRMSSGYSWADGKGIKTQSNQGGLVFYLNQPTEVEVTLMHAEAKNPHDVTVHVYVLPEADYKQFDDNKEQEDKNKAFSTLTTSGEDKSFTVSITAENKNFTGSTTLQSGYYALVPVGSASNTYLNAIEFKPGCSAPAEALVLKADKTADVVAGDEITFSTEGGNNAEVTIAGKNGETITANKWTAVKGEHTFTASQDVKDGICGNTVELKIVVAGTDPVTSAAITGSNTAKVGKEAILTCEAAEATSFQWYKDGAKIDGATSETYSFTPDAAGEIVFACEAWNKNNTDENHAKSADFKVTVSEGDCGLLIKASRTGSKVATVDPNSVVGGTAETNMTEDKLNKKCFFGVTLADGAFAEGDIFIMNITTAADMDGSLKLYEDKAGSNLIIEITEGIDGTGEKQWKLPAAAAGKKSIYVYRGNVSDWNAYFNYIAVKRSCGNESSDASLKYLVVNGDTVKAENNVYNYDLSVSFKDAKVKVKYELNDAKAKSSKELEFDIFAPDEIGDTQSDKFTVTAEDGTAVEYTVNITRVMTDDSDAGIKELKVNNEVVEEKEGVFAYEVPADKKLANVTVEFELNSPNAKASKASGFEMKVPAAGEKAEETIEVVSKDGTKKSYTVSITKAEGGEEEGGDDEGLEDILSAGNSIQKVMLNGQLFILKNGVLYNATGAVVK